MSTPELHTLKLTVMNKGNGFGNITSCLGKVNIRYTRYSGWSKCSKTGSCAFKSLKWEYTHPWEIGKLDKFFSIAKHKAERVIRIAQERSEKHEIDRLLKEKIENFDGNHVSSPEERKQIINVIMAYHTRKLLNMFESKMYDEKLNNISDKNP